MTHDHRTMAYGPMPCGCYILDVASYYTTAFLATRAGHLAALQVVVLDFTGIEAVTGAYADELVAKLRAEHGDRVRWEGANEEVAETIRTAIARRATATPRS